MCLEVIIYNGLTRSVIDTVKSEGSFHVFSIVTKCGSNSEFDYCPTIFKGSDHSYFTIGKLKLNVHRLPIIYITEHYLINGL